ncbi:MAG: hypothetical protein MI919_33230, partial [Holophagales bacterium]|nr:hypothetical protein [Holophagales bacterium]
MTDSNDRGAPIDPGPDPPPELRRALAALPREVAPEHDLWPGIRDRLATRQHGEIEGEPRFRPARRSRGPFAGPLWRQALAAPFFTAVGASLACLAARRGLVPLSDGVVAQAARPSARAAVVGPEAAGPGMEGPLG